MAFDVILYKTASDRNRLTKTLTDAKTYSCILKEQADVLAPSIRISTSDNLSAYNYAYISHYGRYYYITKLETTPNGYWVATMEGDPLMSWATQIKACPGTITRSEDIFDAYLNDSEYNAESYRKYVTKRFPTALDDDCFILMTVG